MRIFMVLFLLAAAIRAQQIEPGGEKMFTGVKEFGPLIPRIEISKNHTVGEALDIIRQAGLKEDRSFAFAVELEKHELKAPVSGILTAKKIPLSVALYDICNICHLDFSYQNGLWQVSPPGT